MKKLAPLFFVILCKLSLYSQSSTIRQVFNFAVGDSFEYTYGFHDFPAGPCREEGYAVMTITSVSSQGDSLIYGWTYSAHDTFVSQGGFCNFPNESVFPDFTYQTSGWDQSGLVLVNADSSLPTLFQDNDTMYHVPKLDTVFINSNYNFHKQNRHSVVLLNSDDQTFADSVGLVSRNMFYESLSVALSQSIIYYYKAGTGEHWGQYIPPPTNIYSISGSVSKSNAAIPSAIVYLIKQDTIGHLKAVDSILVNAYGNFFFNHLVKDTYYIKAALLPTDSNYNNYLPTYLFNSLHWDSASPVVFSNFTQQGSFNLGLIAGINPGGPGFVGGYVSQGANVLYEGGSNNSRGVGSPLDHVQINLLTSAGQAVAYTYTDVDGHYAFQNLAYGTYFLYAEELNKIASPIYFTLSPQIPVDSNVNISINSHFATSVNEVKDVTIEIYPNPAPGNFTLLVSELPSSSAHLKLYDLAGREVKDISIKGMQSIIGCGEMASGIYCWEVVSPESVLKRGKLVVR